LGTKPATKRNPSAMKRVRQTEKRRMRNAHVKSTVKTATKRADSGIASGNIDEAREKVLLAAQTIAKAAAKGVLHKRTAARRISRLTRRLNKSAAVTA